MYAVIRTGGKQYKVSAGDIIDIEKVAAEAGDKVDFDVIFICDGSNIIVDADQLAKAEVTGEVVEHFKGEKQIVFKFKKRKGYKRTKGHRQQLTKVQITKIAAPGCETATFEKPEPAVKAEPVVEAEAVVEAEPVVEAAPVAEAATEAVVLEKMTVAQLKEYAADKEISLKGITKKAEIIEAIKAAE